jgi:hypothetical protein
VVSATPVAPTWLDAVVRVRGVVLAPASGGNPGLVPDSVRLQTAGLTRNNLVTPAAVAPSDLPVLTVIEASSSR